MTKEDQSSIRFKVNGRMWIECNDQPFLGYGRVELLEKIKELGSLNKASKEMKMSYQQAWQLVDSINKSSKAPLVILQRGGKGGGSAILTTEGYKAIEMFKEINEKFQNFLKEESSNIRFPCIIE